MTVIRWAPLREITSLQREMDRILDQVQEKWEYPDTDFTPRAELINADGQIAISFELPGLSSADVDGIDIQVTAQSVTVRGEKSKPETVDTHSRSEFNYGKFHRVINLPAKVHNEQVSAQYEQGILRLVLPKLVADENKVVKVSVAKT